MMVIWAATLVAVAGLLWFLLLRVTRRGPDDGRASSASAEEILRQRYARGEIDRDTYLRMLDDLGTGCRAESGSTRLCEAAVFASDRIRNAVRARSR